MKLAPKIHRSLWILSALTLIASGVATAQDEQQAKPDRMLRLLPLGEEPPWEEVNTGERRIQKEAPPGSVPPQEIVQLDAAGIEKGDAVRLRLNQLSGGLPVGPAVLLYDVEEIGQGVEPWAKFAMPGKSHGLAVLWRSFRSGKPTWANPDVLVLPEDATSFPPGSIRFVNVSAWTAEFSIAGQVVRLGPGKHATSRPRGAFTKQPVVVHITGKGGEKLKIADQEITQGAGERTTFFVYVADGEKPRAPAKFKLITENARALPQLPKR